MKISVKVNIAIPEKDFQKCEIEIEPGTTLGTALLALSRNTDLDTVLVAESGKVTGIDDMWEVRVNGTACYSFPSDFDIPLNSGDLVTLWLMPLGGG